MKQIDWNANYRNPMRGKRSQTERFSSSKEMYEQQRADQEMRKAMAEQYLKIEPLLKKKLFEYLVGKKPIQVIKSFKYLTEELQKSEDPEKSLGRYVEVAKDIPSGTVLRFQRINKSLKQWMFVGDDGAEYEIFDSPIVMMGDGRQSRPIQNPGWYGLLLNTNIFEEVTKSLQEGNEE